MIIKFFNIQVTVPEIMIDYYCKETQPMLQWENRKALERLRDAINDVLFTIAENPSAIVNSEHYGNFVKSLAIRVALSKHRVLYDD